MIVFSLQALSHAVDRLAKPSGFDRFQYVIDGIDFKRVYRMFVVCGHKRDEWGPVFLEEPHDAEAIEFGHL
jgi:hypothetical protein